MATSDQQLPPVVEPSSSDLLEKGGSMPKSSPKNELYIPLIGFIPNKVRNHFVAGVAEFCGTFMFLFMAFAAAQIANMAAAQDIPGDGARQDTILAHKANVNVLMYIALGFGFSLAVNAWAFFRISGGLFNPAVALALALVGAIGPIRAIVAFIAEIAGGLAAAGVVAALFPGPLIVTTHLNATTSTARGVFIEMFLTAELVFVILMLAAEKHKGTFLAPIGIGLALFITQLAGVFFTGASLNPARSLGPAAVMHDFPGYFWIYWVGPGLGGALAAGFYWFFKAFRFDTANPGADFDEREAQAFMFDEESAGDATQVARPSLAPPCDDGSSRSKSLPGSGMSQSPMPSP